MDMAKKIMKEITENQKFGNLWICLTFLCTSQLLLWHSLSPWFGHPPPPLLLSCCCSWTNALEHHLLSPGCFLAILWASAALKGIPKSSLQVSCFSSEAPQLPVLLTIMMFTLCIVMVCWWVCIPLSQPGSFAKLESMSYSWLNL